MTDKILLTIVCATRNVEKSLVAFIESYKLSKNSHSELVIVDACSSDKTHIIFNKYKDNIDQLIIEKDKSIYDAWNKGVKAARGSFVSFVGADDLITMNAINEIVDCIKNNPQAEYIHGFNVMMKNGRPSHLIGRPYDNQTIECYMPMAHVMSAHKRDWLVNNGMFDDTFRSSGDYDFLLRMRKSIKIVECRSIFAFVEDAGISRSSTMPILEAHRARIKNDVPYLKSILWTIRGLLGFYIKSFLAR